MSWISSIDMILASSENIVRLILGKSLKRRITFNVLGNKIEVRVSPDGDIDKNISRLDIARENLQEALSAIDELKSTAERHKHDAREFQKKVEMARTESIAVDQIRQINRDELTRLLQLETRSSRLIGASIGFVFGIISSLIASFIYATISQPH